MSGMHLNERREGTRFVPISEARADELRRLVGDPVEVARDLAEFRERELALSAMTPMLIDRYPHKWVAVLATDEVLAADSIEALLFELETRAIPRDTAAIRYIDTDDRTLFF